MEFSRSRYFTTVVNRYQASLGSLCICECVYGLLSELGDNLVTCGICSIDFSTLTLKSFLLHYGNSAYHFS